jgi:hypothetical protein
MTIEANSESDLEKAYRGEYEGSEVNLMRISNYIKARRGEYEGFGVYLRQISNEAKARNET